VYHLYDDLTTERRIPMTMMKLAMQLLPTIVMIVALQLLPTIVMIVALQLRQYHLCAGHNGESKDRSV
jgi:hypothetical protein